MKKWIAIVIIILIIIISPSKSNIFTKKNTDGENAKELNKIEINEGTKYIKYKDNIILGKDDELVSVNSKGEVEQILKLSKNIENFEISSSSYIDILDKKDKKITSIDSNGKTIFTNKVYQDVFMYNSINKDIFVSVHRDQDKEYVKIQDIEKNLIKEIEYSSKITHLESLDDKFIVIDINTDKAIYSKISLYDTNGQVLKSYECDDLAIDAICQNNDIYIAFENKIIVLDSELNEKSEIEINGLKSIEKDKNGNVFLVDKNNTMTCINNDNEKNIKIKPDVTSIEEFGEEYITYSSYSIFDKDNKEIFKSEDKIKDVIFITDNTIAVYIDNLIKIVKL